MNEQNHEYQSKQVIVPIILTDPSITETISEFYGNGKNLPTQHPDPEINNEVLIADLCGKLDTARMALGRVLEINVITPAAVAIKNHARHALDETHPRTLHEIHNNCG